MGSAYIRNRSTKIAQRQLRWKRSTISWRIVRNCRDLKIMRGGGGRKRNKLTKKILYTTYFFQNSNLLAFSRMKIKKRYLILLKIFLFINYYFLFSLISYFANYIKYIIYIIIRDNERAARNTSRPWWRGVGRTGPDGGEDTAMRCARVAMAGNSSSASGGEGVRLWLRRCQGLHPLPAHPRAFAARADFDGRALAGNVGVRSGVGTGVVLWVDGWVGETGEGRERPSLDRTRVLREWKSEWERE